MSIKKKKNKSKIPKAIFFAKDNKEALLYSKALDMSLFIFELGNIQRKHLKYGDYSEEVFNVLEKVFEDINECKYGYNIIVDELL